MERFGKVVSLFLLNKKTEKNDSLNEPNEFLVKPISKRADNPSEGLVTQNQNIQKTQGKTMPTELTSTADNYTQSPQPKKRNSFLKAGAFLLGLMTLSGAANAVPIITASNNTPSCTKPADGGKIAWTNALVGKLTDSSNTTPSSFAVDGVTVNMSYVDQTRQTGGTPLMDYNSGNVGGDNGVINFWQDAPSEKNYMQVVMDFDQPLVGLMPTSSDLDYNNYSGNRYRDVMIYQAFFNGVPVEPSEVIYGDKTKVAIAASNNVAESACQASGNNAGIQVSATAPCFYGIANNTPNTRANGNARAVYNSPVDKIVVTYISGDYGDGDNADNPTKQYATLGDFCWTGHAGMEVTKTQIGGENPVTQPGTLDYQITVKNNGALPLTNITPTDVMPDGSNGALAGPTGDTNGDNVLDMTETWTYTANYEITQADVDSYAPLVNSVSVTSTEIQKPRKSSVTTPISLPPSSCVNQVFSAANGAMSQKPVWNGNGYTQTIGSLEVLSAGRVAVSSERAYGGLDLYARNTPISYAWPNQGYMEMTFNKPLVSKWAVTDLDTSSEESIVKVYDVNGNIIPNPAQYIVTTAEGTTGTYPNGVPTTFNDIGSDVTIVPGADFVSLQTKSRRMTQTFLRSKMVFFDFGDIAISKISVDDVGSGAPGFLFDSVKEACPTEIVMSKSLVSGGPDAEPGETLTYKINMVNVGEVNGSISVDETVPEGTTNIAGDSFPACATGDVAGTTCTQDSPVVPAGGTASMTFSVVVDDPINLDSIENVVIKTGDTPPVCTDVENSDPRCVSIPTGEVTPPVCTAEFIDTTNMSVVNKRGPTLTGTGVTLDGVPMTLVMQERSGGNLGNNSGGAGARGKTGSTWSNGIFTPSASPAGSIITAVDLNNSANDYIDVTITFDEPIFEFTMHVNGLDFSRIQFTGAHTEEIISGGTQLRYNAGTRILDDSQPSTISNPTRDGYGSIKILPTSGAGITQIKYTYLDRSGHASQVDGHSIGFSGCIVPLDEPNLSMTKAATSGNPFAAIDDVIAYEYVVTNTGNVAIDNITVTDDKIPAVTCPSPAADTLAAGASVTCTGTYTVVAADVVAGQVVNVANPQGTPPPGTEIPPMPVPPTVTVPLNPLPNLSMTKEVTNGNPFSNIGDEIDYKYVVTNTGNIDIKNVTVSDNKIPNVTCPTPAANNLVIGASITCTGKYTVKAADIAAGEVVNVANPNGEVPPGTPGIPPMPVPPMVTVPLDPLPNLMMTKEATSGNPFTQVGDVINYKYVVTNTGNIAITNINVTDDKIPAVTCPSPAANSLAVGANIICTATYTVKAADVTAGKVVNIANPHGEVPPGTPEIPPMTVPPTVTVPLKPEPNLSMTKEVTTGNPFANVGDIITYKYVVTNTGNIAITNVTVDDDKIPTVNCPAAEAASLAPSASVTCTASYTVKAIDVAAGEVVNVANPQGEVPPGTPGIPPMTVPPTVTVPLNPDPKMNLVKESSSTPTEAGDIVNYTFTVTNTGNVPLSSIALTDPKCEVAPALVVGGDVNTDSKLDISETWVYTCSYTVTQAEIDAETVDNTASVTGTPPNTPDPIPPVTSIKRIPVAQEPKIEVVKTAMDPTVAEGANATITDPGDTILYLIKTTNTGNVSLSAVTVTDPLLNIDAADCAATSNGDVFLNDGSDTLDVGESASCAVAYTLTQADFDAGKRENTVTVEGTPPNGPPTNGNDKVITSLQQKTSIELLKSSTTILGGNANVVEVGDTVEYTFTVKNTGNVTLTNVDVTDETVGLGLTIACPSGANPILTLTAGVTEVCTATYTLTAEDVAGNGNAVITNGNYEIANDAKVVGTPPATSGLTPPTSTSSALATAQVNTAISLEKSAAAIVDVDADGKNSVGDTVTYSYLVTNTGTSALTGVTVTENLSFSGTGDIPAPAGGLANLAAGASTTFTATYILTQEDVDAQELKNTAKVTGTPPTGLTPPESESSVIVAVKADPSIAAIKGSLVDKGADGVLNENDEVTYTYILENTGNVTLTAVVLNELAGDFTGTNGLPIPTHVISDGGSAEGTLKVGEKATYTATYQLTQDDIDSGQLDNRVEGQGTPPNTPDGTPSTPVKDESDTSNPNDPNESEDPNDPGKPEGNDKTGSLLPADPSISTVKGSVVNKAGAVLEVGDTVTYSYVLENTGNVTLTSVSLSELAVDFTGTGALPIPEFVENDGASLEGTLLPGEKATFTAEYTLTQDDISSGQLDNRAEGQGTPPNKTDGTPSTPVTDESDTSNPNDPNETGDPNDPGKPGGNDPTGTPLDQNPEIAIVKTASVGGEGKAGDTITYTFVVSNTGNVPLTGVKVDDVRISVANLAVADLAVGAFDTVTATYIITPADIAAGKIENQAITTGTPPNKPNGDPSTPVTDNSDNNVPNEDDPTVTLLTQSPAIAIVKTASVAGEGRLGDTITYTFVVSNTGDVPLTNVKVDDGRIGVADLAVPDLAVGASETVTATYVVKPADIIEGKIENQAFATGIPPNKPDGTPGTPVTDKSDNNVPNEDDPTVTPLTQSPAIAIVKTASVGGSGKAGDVITYTFVVSNTGDVPLTGVKVDDARIGVSNLAVADLAVGASDTVTATYIITPADIIARKIENQATATGIPPNNLDGTPGTPVTDESDNNVPNEDDPTVTPLTQSPAIAIVKTASVGGEGKKGDTITYTFVVSNTGDVPLTGVKVDDARIGVSNLAVADLAIGASDTVTATYIITDADIAAGKIENQATATGIPPNNPDGTPATPVTDKSDNNVPNEDDPTVTPLTQSPSIAIVKTASVAGSGVAGDTITYTFVVSNTGNVPLTGVKVDDARIGVSNLAVADLAIGASDTVTATYIITDADVAAGKIENQATATGIPPNNPDGTPATPVTDKSDNNVPNEDDPTVTPLTPPSIALVKSLLAVDDTIADGITGAGDTIRYSFEVTNTGKLVLDPISVTDEKVANISCVATSLAVGASTTCAGDAYVITSADVLAGGVENTATATGTPKNPDGSNGTPVTDKSDAGTKPDGTPVTTPPSETETPSPLAKIPNDPNDPTDDPTTVLLSSSPKIALVKVGNVNGKGLLGETISYTFTVTNVGNVALKNVTVTDQLAGMVVTGTIPTLAVGEVDSTSITGTYTINSTDVNAGQVTNQATVTGEDDKGTIVTDKSDDSSVLEDDPTVTVLDPPVVVDDEQTYVSGEPKTFDIIGNDLRETPIDSNSLRFTETGTKDLNTILSADGKTLIVEGEGTWEMLPGGEVRFTPADGFLGNPTPPTYIGLSAVGGFSSNEASITLKTLIVNQPIPAQSIPTLSEWALIMLMLMLAFVGYRQAIVRGGGVRF